VPACNLAYLCLPPIPEAIICIPFTRRETEITRANRTTPIEIGCAITKADTPILNIPTPTRNALDQLGISLTIMPCTILATPLNSKANAPKNIKNAAACIGKDITTMPKAMTNAPSPILVQRDDLFVLEYDGAIPIATLSNPIISKTIERITIIVYIAIPGNVRIKIDRKMEIAPKLICKNRNQLGDFSVVN
jgi:hypothetical protein